MITFGNLLWGAAGVIVGVVHHAYLHPRLKKLWLALKAKFAKSTL